MADTKEIKVQTENLLSQKTSVPQEIEDNAFIKVLRSCFFIPQRYVLGLMSLMAICNAYTMRVCLNLAITQMVNHTKTSASHYDPNACPSNDVINNITTAPVENPYAIFDWDEETQGFILSGFYYGYATTQVLGGVLSERLGAKWVISTGLLCTAFLTFLSPIVIRAGGGTWLFVLRVLQGMGEGPTIPALMTMLSRWVPPNERSLYGALVFGGGQLGNVFGSMMSGVLLANGQDWAYVFYFFGGFGLVWYTLWVLLCYSTPHTHPYISKKELAYLKAEVKLAENRSTNDPVPWKAILRSTPVWALVFGAVGHDWGFYTMISDLPKYSHDVLNFNIKTTGTLTSLPYIAMWICAIFFGLIGDLCTRKGWHSIRTGRIIHTTIASTGPAICLILASYAGCDRTTAMVYFIVSMGLMGAYNSGVKINTLDLAPNYTGSVTSLLNTTSTFTGILSPYLVGLMTPDSSLAQWRFVFWLCFIVLVATNVVYCFWADGEQQWWDDVRQYGYPPDWKHGPLLGEEKMMMKKKTEDLKVSTEKV